MNSPAPRTDAERSAYLRTVLQLNPLQRAEEILALRNRYRRIKPTGAVRAATEDDPRELRQQAVDGLQRVRDLFWKEKLTVLQQMLDALPLKPFPDLRKAGQRLKVMAANRSEFPALLKVTGLDPDLFNGLKRILVVSPREAGPLKEEIQDALADGIQRKWVRRLLAHVRQELPEVYRLEEDWFDLLRSSSAARWSRRPLEQGSSSGTSPLRYLWFLIPVLVSIVVAVSKPSSPSSRPPSGANSRPPGMPRVVMPSPVDGPAPSESMKRITELLQRRREERQRGLQNAPPALAPAPLPPPNP